MFSIFLLDVEDDIFVQKKEKTYASKGEHGRENFGGGGITKVMKSYQGGSL